MRLQENTTFADRYQLERLLGRGGFSEVWLAHDSYIDIDVAIKIYAPGQGMDPNSINEFRREITGVFQLNHPNLLCPKHLGIWENMPYLIMAYCPAGSCLKFVGNIAESEIWHLIHDVAAGLAYLHEKDIVHQDIKPDNILIDTEGNYLITDFGISTRARSTLRKSVMSTTNSAGTLAYMGPERFSTQPAPTKASDIWSLGAMLYELLEGVTPFPPDFGGSMLNAGAAIPAINAPVSENLKQTIYKMLSKETWDRPTADILVKWVSDFFHQSTIDDNDIKTKPHSRSQERQINTIIDTLPTKIILVEKIFYLITILWGMFVFLLFTFMLTYPFLQGIDVVGYINLGGANLVFSIICILDLINPNNKAGNVKLLITIVVILAATIISLYYAKYSRFGYYQFYIYLMPAMISCLLLQVVRYFRKKVQ